jgi:hypothetical protein
MIALGLAAGALTVGGTSAQADAVVDVSGNVSKAVGGALVDFPVSAYVQSGNQFYEVDSTSTDAAGNYAFTDLDAASRAANYPGTSPRSTAIRNATSVKIQFFGGQVVGGLHTNPGYLTRAYGGFKTLTNSPAVPVNGAPVVANQALPSAAGMIVRVTGATGAPVTNNGFVSILEAGSSDPLDAYADYDGGDTSSDDDFYDNPATPADESVNAPKDGLVYVYGLEPGTYAVSAGGSDFEPTTGVYRNYLSRFIGGDGTYATATPITATAGTFAGTGAQLTDVLTTTESPRIIGDSSFGSTLVADPGTWLRQQGTEFTYTWLRKGAVVSTAPSYKLSKADKKQKISLIVRAVSSGEFVGAAAAKPTSKVGEKSKVKAKRDGYGFDVTVKVAKKSKARKLGTPKGKVVLMTLDGEIASKKAKLKGGKVNDLTPKRAFLSETKYVVEYLGGGKLGSDTATAKAGKGGGKKKKK